MRLVPRHEIVRRLQVIIDYEEGEKANAVTAKKRNYHAARISAFGDAAKMLLLIPDVKEEE